MKDPYVVEIRTAAGAVLIGPFDSREQAVVWAGSVGTIIPLFPATASAGMLIATASVQQAMDLLIPKSPVEPLVTLTDQ
jgi:hypothetical protein